MPSNQSNIDQIAERVERLLVRHAELQRTNALLANQVEALTTQERDSLKSRLGAARARVEALLDRLPQVDAQAAASSKSTRHETARSPDHGAELPVRMPARVASPVCSKRSNGSIPRCARIRDSRQGARA
jgi:cell division protein ZapB